jgi:hypothetical protein
MIDLIDNRTLLIVGCTALVLAGLFGVLSAIFLAWRGDARRRQLVSVSEVTRDWQPTWKINAVTDAWVMEHEKDDIPSNFVLRNYHCGCPVAGNRRSRHVAVTRSGGDGRSGRLPCCQCCDKQDQSKLTTCVLKCMTLAGAVLPAMNVAQPIAAIVVACKTRFADARAG